MTASNAFDKGGIIQQRNLVDQVADYLTQAIISQYYTPGERLSEVQLARDLGVSRAPVREAARLLESRGLLVSQPRRGFFVRALDAAELNDIFDLRLCLERHALARLVETYDAEKEAALRSQVELMCEVALHDNDSRKIEEDLVFHRMVISFSGNQRLLKAYDDITHELRLCIALIGKTHADPDSISTSHWPLLDALASGDPDQCREAIDYHIGVAQHYVVKGIGEAL
ncbi:GntR family transcriptional regulator [Billgrantia kenyensis]|uniref:GntR family transcriptional regulator n=1 Tax=Billgrantia kenyensis TaxID=321266 RepID=A0A7V9VY19_9GAMM|nr:GntR family transcriptional regulator [Halomonas kenyensis]MBA2777528.1 GntR family transcriptional regulator [Halomonas kenyensis]MCG6660198.1 GntR family transcriptional regulator [Halomonas kenyensis]